MNAIRTLAPVALLVSTLLAPVQASVYVTNPVATTVCHGGQECPVQWVDNGESPLLSDIGTASVGLYTGEFALAQTLPSVDVSATSSFTFTPDPAAGPNGQYYLVFSNSAINYVGFSGSFTLDSMTGTTPGGGASSTASPTSTGTVTVTTTATTTFASVSVTSTTVTGTETTTNVTTVPTTTVVSSATSPVNTTIVTTSGSTTLTITTTHSVATTTTSAAATATTSSAAFRADSSNSLAMAFFLACVGALAL